MQAALNEMTVWSTQVLPCIPGYQVSSLNDSRETFEITVRVHFLGGLAVAAGTPQCVQPCRPGIPLRELVSMLVTRYPGIEEYCLGDDGYAAWVNGREGFDWEPIKDCATVVLLPAKAAFKKRAKRFVLPC